MVCGVKENWSIVVGFCNERGFTKRTNKEMNSSSSLSYVLLSVMY